MCCVLSGNSFCILIHWNMVMYCSASDSEKELMAFIPSCQEGRIMRTLIGMIHSGSGTMSSCVLTCEWECDPVPAHGVQPWLSYLCRSAGWSHGYEDVPVVLSHGPAKLGPLFPGSMPPHKPLAEELCHAPLRLVCRQGTQGIIHSIW